MKVFLFTNEVWYLNVMLCTHLNLNNWVISGTKLRVLNDCMLNNPLVLVWHDLKIVFIKCVHIYDRQTISLHVSVSHAHTHARRRSTRASPRPGLTQHKTRTAHSSARYANSVFVQTFVLSAGPAFRSVLCARSAVLRSVSVSAHARHTPLYVCVRSLVRV